MGSRSGKLLTRCMSFAVAAVLLYGGLTACAAGASGGSAAPQASAKVPELYTTAQATAGKQQFMAHCAVCHGNNLEGRAGPTLKGPDFAPSKQRPTLGAMFSFLSSMMPAPQPGSLPHKAYVQLMAFILQQNGYPAGSNALTYDAAEKSKVMLSYHGK